MNEEVKNFIESRKKKIIISLIGFALPLFLVGFTLFISVFLVLGLFEGNSNNGFGGGFAGGSLESGSFTLNRTLLSKNEFRDQLTRAVSSRPMLQIFAENANTIYDTAEAANVNPELVVVRAIAEGFSPANVKNNYNYWGIGCFNTGNGDCEDYKSFNEGLNRFIGIIGNKANLTDMMSSYAYIGDYWYNPGSSSLGGCYYAPYIYDVFPDRVQQACVISNNVCDKNSTANCIKTTDEDQMAYANWQVKKMLAIRDEIFDVKVTSDTVIGSTTSSVNIMTLSDRDAWYALTGFDSMEAANRGLNEPLMNSRIVVISVPIRVWANNNPNDYSVKSTSVKLRVNRELSTLFTNFFNDVYNETGSGENLFVINPSEVGCYNFRKATGSNRLSAHAYGAACDLNWSSDGNGYGDTVYTRDEWKKLKKSKEKYQIIYKDSKVANIMHKYTFSWGGEWNNNTDAMHFSFIGDDTRAYLQGRG